MKSRLPHHAAQQPGSADVVVVGAGAAGMATAITAARLGANVQLVDVDSAAGGTVARALIHTLGGIYDERQQCVNDGIVCELVDRLERASASTRRRKIGRTWCLNVCPDVYQKVVTQWIAEEPLIQTMFLTRIADIAVRHGRVEELALLGPVTRQRVRPTTLVDTTGAAAIVRMIDRDLVHDDEERAAGGWIFRLRGVRPGAVAFPKGVVLVQRLRTAARDGLLPPLCAQAWIDQGVFEDEVFVKLFVPLAGEWNQPDRHSQIVRDAAGLQGRVIEYLAQFPDFAGARLTQTGALGVRDGGRIKGDYYLTVDDVRAGRRFADAACRCCWPIEYWHPRAGLQLEYLEPGVTYEIPLRALKVAGLANVWAAGKCLSADHHAQASARVVGQCWSMGEAVGRTAAAEALVHSSCM
jgi:hypothetical protein